MNPNKMRNISLLSIWSWRLFNLLVSLLVDAVLRTFDQNRSCPKVDLSDSKKRVLRAKKHMLFGTRVVHFWARIWSGQRDWLVVGSEQWDDKNTTPNYRCKTPGPDRRASYSINIKLIIVSIFYINLNRILILKSKWKYNKLKWRRKLKTYLHFDAPTNILRKKSIKYITVLILWYFLIH